MGTTPGFPEPLEEIAGGDSEAVLLAVREAAMALVGVCTTEFFREDFFDEREVPTARVFALLRFLFLMTSVFNDKGRTTP